MGIVFLIGLLFGLLLMIISFLIRDEDEWVPLLFSGVIINVFSIIGLAIASCEDLEHEHSWNEPETEIVETVVVETIVVDTVYIETVVTDTLTDTVYVETVVVEEVENGLGINITVIALFISVLIGWIAYMVYHAYYSYLDYSLSILKGCD